jgi:hypothetical protein
MPHPESTNKFIQCTKRGEMFVFNCQNANLVWNEQTNKCEKLVEREAKMLFFKKKSKNLGQKLKFLSSQLNTDSDENETSMGNPMANNKISQIAENNLKIAEEKMKSYSDIYDFDENGMARPKNDKHITQGRQIFQKKEERKKLNATNLD